MIAEDSCWGQICHLLLVTRKPRKYGASTHSTLGALFHSDIYSAWAKCDRRKGFLQHYSRSVLFSPFSYLFLHLLISLSIFERFRVIISVLFILFVRYSINVLRMSCCMYLLVQYWTKKILLAQLCFSYKRTRWLHSKNLQNNAHVK